MRDQAARDQIKYLERQLERIEVKYFKLLGEFYLVVEHLGLSIVEEPSKLTVVKKDS